MYYSWFVLWFFVNLYMAVYELRRKRYGWFALSVIAFAASVVGLIWVLRDPEVN